MPGELVEVRGFPLRRIWSLGAMGMGAWPDSRVVRPSPASDSPKKMTFRPKFIFGQKRHIFHQKSDLRKLEKSLFEEKKPLRAYTTAAKCLLFKKSYFWVEKITCGHAPHKHNACFCLKRLFFSKEVCLMGSLY